MSESRSGSPVVVPGTSSALNPLAGSNIPTRPLSWQEKYGCELLVSNDLTPPTLDALDTLDITNAAYIRWGNKLYYVNKETNECLLLELTTAQLARFDLVFKVRFNNLNQQFIEAKKRFNDEELELVTSHINHTHLTRRQKRLSRLGKISSAIIAVASGITTAGAFIALNLATGGLALLGALLIFVAGTAVNWWIFKNYTPSVLIDLFGRESFFLDEKGDPLSKGKKAAIAIALGLSLSVGITFAALTWASTFTLSSGLPFLAALPAFAFPPLAALLAGVTLICMTALMLKDIAKLIKKKDVIGECRKFLKNMISLNPDLEQNRGKSRSRIIIERCLTVFLIAVFIPLAIIGLYTTMNACAPGVKAILFKIPHISSAIAGILAQVISLGLALIGQVPFGIQTVFQTTEKIVSSSVDFVCKLPSRTKALCQSIANFFSRPRAEASKAVQAVASTAAKAKSWTWDDVLSGLVTTVALTQVTINALGNGLIAMMGAVGSTVLGFLALIGGTANSAFAGIPAALGSKPKIKAVDKENRAKLLESKTTIRDDHDLHLELKRSVNPYKSFDTSPLRPLGSPAEINDNSAQLPSPKSTREEKSTPSVGRNNSAMFSPPAMLRLDNLQSRLTRARRGSEEEVKQEEKGVASRSIKKAYAQDDSVLYRYTTACR